MQIFINMQCNLYLKDRPNLTKALKIKKIQAHPHHASIQTPPIHVPFCLLQNH